MLPTHDTPGPCFAIHTLTGWDRLADWPWVPSWFRRRTLRDVFNSFPKDLTEEGLFVRMPSGRTYQVLDERGTHKHWEKK